MLNSIQKEILNGLMLGDGCLEKAKAGKNASLRIGRKRDDKNYLLYHADIFKDLNVSIKDREIFDKRTNKIYYQSHLRTSVNNELTAMWSKWYPNGKKIVPNDLILTPLTIATWFADDGSVKVRKRIYDIKLATNGFTHEEVVFLQLQLISSYHLDVKMYEDKSGSLSQWTLRIINKENVRKFIEIIKPVFPKGMERKSFIWENNIELLAPKIYPNCKFCNSDQISKNGSNNCDKQKYLCKKCGRQFII